MRNNVFYAVKYLNSISINVLLNISTNVALVFDWVKGVLFYFRTKGLH